MLKKIPVELQKRVAAEVQQERHYPRAAHQKPSPEFRVKDPKKVIRKLQPRVAAEAQQARHPAVKGESYRPDWTKKRPDLAGTRKSAEEISAGAKKLKFQSKVKAKLLRSEGVSTAAKPSLRTKAASAIGRRMEARAAAKAAKAAATTVAEAAPKRTIASKALGAAGKTLKFAGKTVKFAGRASIYAGAAAGAVDIGKLGAEAARAHKAGKTLERQAAQAEKKHGLKVKVEKPSMLGTLAKTVGTVGMWEPEVKVDIKYPKAKPLSEKAKKRLKSLGQM